MYVAPAYALGTPLIPRMQSSLRPMWTTFAFHDWSALTEAASVGPSKMPQPWMQAYSGPDRLTPRRVTTFPDPSTSLFPWTRRPLDGSPPPPQAAVTALTAGRAEVLPAASNASTASV